MRNESRVKLIFLSLSYELALTMFVATTKDLRLELILEVLSDDVIIFF